MDESKEKMLRDDYRADLAVLQSYVDKYPREVIPSVPFMTGFLTGLGCYPDIIVAQEYFDVLIPPDQSHLLSDAELAGLTHTLGGFGDYLALRVMAGDVDFILSYYEQTAAENAFDSESHFHQWIEGWCRSIFWLADAWQEILDSLRDLPDLVKEFRSAQSVILYFHGRESADFLSDQLAEGHENPKTGIELDQDFFHLIPGAVSVLVECYDLFQPMTSEAAEKGPGRNDLCPCGSGKKYKQCCLSKTYENSESE